MVQRAPGGRHTFSINCASPLQDSNRETAHRGKDMQGIQIFHSQGSQGTRSNLIQTTRRIKSSLYTIRSSGPFDANTAGEYASRIGNSRPKFACQEGTISCGQRSLQNNVRPSLREIWHNKFLFSRISLQVRGLIEKQISILNFDKATFAQINAAANKACI